MLEVKKEYTVGINFYLTYLGTEDEMQFTYLTPT